MLEKNQIEDQTAKHIKVLEKKIGELEEELDTAKRQVAATVFGAHVKQERIEEKIVEIESKLKKEQEDEKVRIRFLLDFLE